MDESATELRGIKRIRQACQNCRRKKTRCSGERPICSFCARLGQQCRYDAGDDYRNGGPHPDTEELAARLALLENRLMQMCDLGPMNTSMGIDANDFANDQTSNTALSGIEQTPRPRPRAASIASARGDWYSNTNKQEPPLPVKECKTGTAPAEPPGLSPVPVSPAPLEAQLAAADLYFERCHNQPYCYFAEQSFRQQLGDGQIPQHLLFAIMATASRFSDEGADGSTIDGYARAAWSEILQRSLANEDTPTVDLVQTTNLLAVVDFTGGRLVQGWIKIGLAIRYAQELHMMAEPDESLTASEREERRRVFWSVYLLDRLASCGRDRPLVFRDEDCQVSLPSSEVSFRQGLAEPTRTLPRMLEGPHAADLEPDNFALTIMTASCLGRTARYMLQRRGNDQYPLWNSKSEYCSIASCLLTVETYLVQDGLSLTQYIGQKLSSHGSIDQQRCGHFLFGRALFHLSHILLTHPYLLHERLQNSGRPVPPSFLEESSRRCQSHAEQLTTTIDEARAAGCYVETSFYGYCIVVAGTIHCISSRHKDQSIEQRSAALLDSSFMFLKSLQRRWKHFPCLFEALTNILAMTKNSTQPDSNSTGLPWLQTMKTDNALWSHALDYSSLCDCKTSASSSPASSNHLAEPMVPPPPDLSSAQDHITQWNTQQVASATGQQVSPSQTKPVNLDCFSFDDIDSHVAPPPDIPWDELHSEEIPWITMPFDTLYWQESTQRP